MHVAIFTSASVQKGKFVYKALETADEVIAADCGAASAVSLGILPKVVLGDFDSIDQAVLRKLKNSGSKIITSPAHKDETDTQLAINYAIEQGATKISLIGGIEGNRLDHLIANISLTYNAKISVQLVNGPSKTWTANGPQNVCIEGKENDLLSLFALSQTVKNIITKGLYYPLSNEPLYFGIPRGISNVFNQKEVSVSFQEGILLFIHTNLEELRHL